MTKNEFIRQLIDKTKDGTIFWVLERNNTLVFIPNGETVIRDFYADYKETRIYVVEQLIPGYEYGDDRITVTIAVIKKGVLSVRIYPDELTSGTYEEFIECIQQKEDNSLDDVFADDDK